MCVCIHGDEWGFACITDNNYSDKELRVEYRTDLKKNTSSGNPGPRDNYKVEKVSYWISFPSMSTVPV